MPKGQKIFPTPDMIGQAHSHSRRPLPIALSIGQALRWLTQDALAARCARTNPPLPEHPKSEGPWQTHASFGSRRSTGLATRRSAAPYAPSRGRRPPSPTPCGDAYHPTFTALLRATSAGGVRQRYMAVPRGGPKNRPHARQTRQGFPSLRPLRFTSVAPQGDKEGGLASVFGASSPLLPPMIPSPLLYGVITEKLHFII